ncbi:hypothetical protein CMUS01_07149 [Colletotrichum musicola]|uniref:NACHT domain-containing protein n=1 Tax=Colletotrichum musicola TaxID=2175873 RepID=A0A8H6KJG6_9PEZI|nr:hypothetical protein CMUS01_07149 [Colletotrichum musicola]
MGASSLIERLTALQDNLINPVETPVSDKLLRIAGEARISINNLLSASARLTPEMVILKKLYFDSIYSREDNIENADSNTFRWMIEEEPGDSEGETQDSLDKTRRKEAREQFQGWLSGRSGIFHISGKAGSGKSTLMKLLFTDAQSRVELRRWAGERKLIFARFFAFKAGDRLQWSFEGLQRPILFETLKQLIAESTKLDHCICFFIDGLDEFGDTEADRLHQERLAEQLNLWASTSENVKILVSSRPYRAFHDAFPNHQRIRFHQLTRDDITQFSRNIFEKDENFEKVKDCYKKLVDRVVGDADGVFLWARLVMRSLILATRRSTKLAYLEKHLDRIPKDLNDLYDRLIFSIGVIDRPMAFKMLLLVAEMETLSIKLPPVALSWIDDLDDTRFPAVADLAPYTYKEVSDRENTVEEWLDECTKGLLEISTVSVEMPGDDGESFRVPRKTVQFFHRTVLDIVRESRLLQSFAGENPGFFTLETPSRLILAQLWFLDSSNLIPLQTIETYLVVRTSEKDKQANLGKLRRVADRRQSGGSGTFSARSTFPHWTTMPAGHPQLKMSFLHWVARRSNTPDYVRDEVSKAPDLLRSEDGLLLVVSASFNPRTTATLWGLFELAASPNEEVRLGGGESKHQTTTATAWAILCVVYICHAIAADGNDYSEALGQFLTTNSVDTNCVALISAGRTHAEAERTEPTRYISLRQLIQQTELPNLERLESLMDEGESVGSTTMKAPSLHDHCQEKSDLTELIAQYAPFDISMQDEPRTWVVRSKDQDLLQTERFYVHSVIAASIAFRKRDPLGEEDL